MLSIVLNVLCSFHIKFVNKYQYFMKWMIQGSGRLNHFTNITQPVCVKISIHIQVSICLTPNWYLCFIVKCKRGRNMIQVDQNWGPRRRSHRTSEEGPSRCKGRNQMSVSRRWEHFTECIERVQVRTEHLGDSERKQEACFCSGSEVFIVDCGLEYLSSQSSRNWLEQGQGPRCFASWSPGESLHGHV